MMDYTMYYVLFGFLFGNTGFAHLGHVFVEVVVDLGVELAALAPQTGILKTNNTVQCGTVLNANLLHKDGRKSTVSHLGFGMLVYNVLIKPLQGLQSLPAMRTVIAELEQPNTYVLKRKSITTSCHNLWQL